MWQKNYVAMKGPQVAVVLAIIRSGIGGVLGSGNTVDKELPLNTSVGLR